MNRRTGCQVPSRRLGFSLIELLLATALLLLLLGAVAFNFSSLQHGVELDEGARRFETLCRFARAQAAFTGRKVVIQFAPEGSDTNPVAPELSFIQLLWEPDPLTEPGQLRPLPSPASDLELLNELVGVLTPSQSPEPAPAPASPDATEQDKSPIQETTDLAAPPSNPSFVFYPDGSSESAEVVLAARNDQQDTRHIAVRIAGLTGSVSRRVLPSGEDVLNPTEQAQETEPLPESSIAKPQTVGSPGNTSGPRPLP